MKNKLLSVAAFTLALSMLLSSCIGSVPASDTSSIPTTEGETEIMTDIPTESVELFSAGFEDSDGIKEPDGSIVSSSGITSTEYGIKGNGLEVMLDTLSGSEDYLGSENKYNLFDGKTATKFLTKATKGYVQFALSSPATVKCYEVISANDEPTRDPKSWTLYGSNDGKEWTEIDKQTAVSFTARFQTKQFKIKNAKEYKWYKFDITANCGGSMIQFSGLELYDSENVTSAGDTNAVKVDLSSIKGTSELSTAEGKTKLFDGDEGTKLVVSGTKLWVSFKVKDKETIGAYSVTSANDWPTRDPQAWTLYGSDDGKEWTEIDSRSGETFSSRYDKKTYKLKNTVEYTYYKFDVTKNSGASDYTQLSDLTLLLGTQSSDAGEGMTVKRDFGPTQTDTGKPGAWTGSKCLAVFGEQSSKKSSEGRNIVYSGLNIKVEKYTTLSYLIFPGLFNIKSYDYEYRSCRVMIDLHFTDGSYLSSLGARDQNGSLMTPEGQVKGECLFTEQWNYIESRIGDVAAGKTIDRIDVYFSMGECLDLSKFITFFDDIKIESKAPVKYEHLSDYINIIRGTNNDSAFSRGLCTPGVTVPNGFNFYTPVTNPSKNTASYNYQVNGDNNPLDSISVMHAPSYWLGSYGTWQFMPNTSVDVSEKISSVDISSDARKSKFSHENETPNAHYYAVTLDEGSAASGVKIEVTPTSHAAYVRFTFPENSENVNIIFDSIWASGTLNISDDGKTFTAVTNHTSAGGGKMYVVGEFDEKFENSKLLANKQGIVSFPKGTKTVTMKIATSFISENQARHSLELEIGNKDFDAVLKSAQSEWDALCGKFEIEGASFTELTNFYSCLYRMYAYPNLFSENEGTNESPKWVYASPYRSGLKQSGILYTNNGFWDTYRTTWAGYSLFTADKDGEMLDGIVQHYIDSGWIPRWICPGATNCMVGTSSDIIFADAYIKGIRFNYEKAWESMVENATAYSANLTNGGRPDNNTSIFLGYVDNSKGEGYSSSIEGYLNDYGLYRMADAMGLEAEAEYYLTRCLRYTMLFNKDAGFFMGKSRAGVFSASKATYDPAAWGGPKGDYTESVGWVNTFPAVYDPEGMVKLYGGREALAKKLNTLFDDSIQSMKKVVTGVGHEICEFKEVKMGQYEHNNQPAHHVIFTYAVSSEPWRVQQYSREVLRHVYVGSEIGQGYPGDEDNGEMSAWYIFNALGFYPYALASGEYVISSPLFEKVTVHLDNGKDIVITAKNNSQDNIYIQSATINGEKIDRMFLTHEELTNGCEIVYEMGDKPSDFGNNEQGRPSSISAKDKIKEYKTDMTDGADLKAQSFTKADASVTKTTVFTTIENAAKLFDGNLTSNTNVKNGESIVVALKDKKEASFITVGIAKKNTAVKGVKIEGSSDGSSWTTLKDEKDCKFLFDTSANVIGLENKGEYKLYKITFTGDCTLSEVEIY